ncbi:SdpI family protein [Streptomyces sp. ET3-23]|uniref:SdpI family protein n=1 Tax=Streptomyces sp. ET3-23 TaxID=2885643 RepID=UPI001D129810|nr:SdpI family protein [Streptomyces sp. ET3-23]MCC2277757.1 SdpI family protein [Streptomyces sp. ET3-23]
MSSHLVVGVILAVVYLVAAGVVLAVARAGGKGALGRNAFVGVRTKATLDSEAAWRTGQRAVRKRYLRLVPVLLVAAVAALVNGLADGPSWAYIAIVAASGAVDVAVAVSSASAADTAARREHGPA